MQLLERKEGVNLFQSKLIKVLVIILLMLLIILVGTRVTFLFTPLVVFFQTLFIPFIIAGVLFYLLRPVVNFLHSKKMPTPLAILLIYLVLIGVGILLVTSIGPVLQRQVMNLVDNAPILFQELQRLIIQYEDHEIIARFQETENFSIEETTNNLTAYLTEAFDFLASNILSFLGVLTSFLLILIIVPFMLFYLLKDGNKAPHQVLRFFPKKQQADGYRILHDMDEKLSSYIQGQIIVSFCVGVLMYIALVIIGVEYSLILALIAMLTNVVPFIGPWIGAVPAAIVAIIDSPITFLWVALAIVVIQQIESNFISPQIMGKKLAVHPLTIIILILVAGKFAGFLGLILAVPFYAVTKVIVSHTYRLWQLRRKANAEDSL
ncbi:AI-2E family transporter [Salipaludibacillus neizhouensis]|uniref:AI-2E family transporter n=1 Tax=Salipaludibacillus neizhouensis TaxID=885475 RepID=UPI0016045810|nr:AI-2E family transporter [Salipaludibacillus neizhouensis]